VTRPGPREIHRPGRDWADATREKDGPRARCRTRDECGKREKRSVERLTSECVCVRARCRSATDEHVRKVYVED